MSGSKLHPWVGVREVVTPLGRCEGGGYTPGKVSGSKLHPLVGEREVVTPLGRCEVVGYTPG